MKKMTKKFAALLAVGLLVSCLPSLAAESLEPAEEENPKAQTACEKLVQLGLLTQEDQMDFDQPVSRGTFVHLLLSVSGDAESGAAGTTQVFADVPPSAVYANEVNTAYALGYISGDEKGRFQPEAEITGSEALKLVLGILGYGPYADQSGGYPAGYLKLAARLGLTDGTGLAETEPVTFSAAVILLENAVDTDLMEITKIGETVELEPKKGKTILTERFSIFQTESVIEANAYTDLLAPDSGLGSDEVMASEKRFQTGNTQAADMLGMKKRLYYYDDKTGALPVLRYLEDCRTENRILTLKPDEVGTLSGNTLEYFPAGGRTKRAVLSENATLIWNGKMTSLTADKLNPESGEVVLISNDGDTAYDVVKVMSYQTIVVSGVSTNHFAVSPKGGVRTSAGGEEGAPEPIKVVLDPQDPAYDTVIRKNGTPAAFENIAPGQVLSYAESESGEKALKTVLISETTVSGTVDQISEDSITIGGMEYDVSEAIRSTVHPGREGTFYLDAFDRVVYIGGTLDIVYGYLNGINVDLFDEVTCRIFTENSRWVTLPMRDRVNFNGQSTLAVEVARALGKKPEEYRQLVRYLVNTDGQIKTLDTAQTFPQGSEEEKRAIDENTFRLTTEGTKLYRNGPQSFDGLVSVGAGAKLFIVPAQTNGPDEDSFEMVGVSELAPDYSYTFEAYEGNLVRTATVFVLKDYTKPLNSGNSISNVMIVQELCQTLDADQTAAPGLRGFWKGLDFALPVRLSSKSAIKDVNQLQKGDIIQFSYNDNGEIDTIDRKYQAGAIYSIAGGVYNSSTFISGKVVTVDAAEQRAIIEYSAPGEPGKLGSTVVTTYSGVDGIYLYEPSLKRYTSGTFADLMEGDLVFGTYRYLQCRELVIIRD